MSILSISGLFICVTSFVLLLILLIYGKTKPHRIWTIFNIAVLIWGAGCFLAGRAESSSSAQVAWSIAYIGGYFLPVFYYHTVSVFCELKRNRFLIFAYAFTIISAILTAIPSRMVFDNWRVLIGGVYYSKATVLYVLIYFGWLSIIALSQVVLAKFLRKAKGIKRIQAFYLFIAFLIGFIGGGSVVLPAFNINILPFGNFGVALYAIIGTYAILKYRLLDIRVVISRAVAFFISYPIFIGIAYFFAYRMYPYLYPALGMHWWLVPTGLIVFFASMAPLAYGQIRSRMENTLLAEQKRYQKLLLQAAKGMATEHNLKKLSKLIAYIVKRAVKIDFAAIFLDEKKDGNYTLKAIRDSGRNLYKDTTFSKNDPFVAYAKKIENPFLYEEMPQAVKASLGMPPQVSLIVPSGVEGNLLGFVLLGEKLNRQAYTEEDMGVFKILSHQAALAVENCLFLEEFKQAQEKIFTAEKLASIGGMADGVAHQIKNRLNQFSVASGELKYEITDFMKKNSKTMAGHPECKKSFKYMLEIADSLIGNVKKTDGIVKGILNFARVEEKETFFSKFSLNEIIKLSNELLCVKHEISQVPLKVEVGARDSIFGVKSQIMEVIYNLLDNGFEAIDEKKAIFRNQGKPEFQEQLGIKLINTRLYYHIEVSDNGIGVEQADSPKLFAPFFTTKSSHKSGTGIGLYVVRRMVEENHKGKIWFVSKHMEGTTFHIDLPKKH